MKQIWIFNYFEETVAIKMKNTLKVFHRGLDFD